MASTINNQIRSVIPTTPEANTGKICDPKNILGSGELHPEMEKRVKQLAQKATEQGLSVFISAGFRSSAEQEALYAQGRTTPGEIVTNARGGSSMHNYGLAADVVFADAKCRPSWSESNDWNKLGEIGKSVGLEWGGDWKDFNDRPHFQYTNGQTPSTLKKVLDTLGLSKVWETIK